MLLRLLLLGAVLLPALAACAPPVMPAPRVPADPAQHVIFHNGVVVTMEAGQPVAEALAVRGDKIEAVGPAAEVLAARTDASVVIDLEGRTLMPGFVDAHTHVFNDARSLGLSLDQAQALALRNGITTVGDLFVDEAFLREMRAFEQAGSLRVRTSLYLVANDPCGRARGNWWRAYPPTRAPGEWLRIGGVKIFTDGGSCGGVALSFDHNDQHGGDLWLEQDALNELVAQAQAAGHQVALHAIGDRAAAQAQTAVALALAGQPNTYRHRLEHVSVLPPELVADFGAVGAVPVLPGQYPSCAPYGPPLPEAYGPWEWPWRALRERNPDLNIGWHTDYPFGSINPMVHLYGFVTRRDVYGGYYTCAPQPWLEDDTLPVDEALAIMTRQSAYALFRETEVGSLAPGKLADLIVLSGNPLTAAPDDLRRLTVLATVVGGQVEHCIVAALCPGYTHRVPVPLPDLRPPVPVRWLVALMAAGLPLAVVVWARPGNRVAARLGGLAGVVGGAVWAVVWWWPGEAAFDHGWPIMAAAGLVALAAAGLRAHRSPSWLAAGGLVLAAVSAIAVAESMVAMAWFNNVMGWLVFAGSIVLHGLALALHGAGGLRRRAGRRLSAAVLAAGLLGGPGALLLSTVVPEYSSGPVWLLGLAVGGAWMALGASTLLARAPGAARAQPASPPA